MPTPNKGESKDKYISRCIPIVINEGTTKDSKQAAAICFSLWKQHHKHAKANDLIDNVGKSIVKQINDRKNDAETP